MWRGAFSQLMPSTPIPSCPCKDAERLQAWPRITRQYIGLVCGTPSLFPASSLTCQHVERPGKDVGVKVLAILPELAIVVAIGSCCSHAPEQLQLSDFGTCAVPSIDMYMGEVLVP